MKKILSFAFLLVALFSFNVYSQSNLTWVVKDKIEDNTFKTKQEFHLSVIGLTNSNEASEYCNKIRSNKDVESCDNLGQDANGSYSINFKMVKPQEPNYYINWAQRLGVTFIEAKGQKKTTVEWLKGERK